MVLGVLLRLFLLIKGVLSKGDLLAHLARGLQLRVLLSLLGISHLLVYILNALVHLVELRDVRQTHNVLVSLLQLGLLFSFTDTWVLSGVHLLYLLQSADVRIL